MASQFLGKRYHLTDFNCNAFSDAFCRRLLSKPIPTWVNRLAYLGSFVKDLLPGSLIQPPADAVQVVQEQSSKKITFTGVGRTLSDNQSTTRGGIRADIRGSPKTARKSATTIISVDDNAPSTRIQVWFPNGNKVQQRFNLVHTVADIYSFVDGMEPEYKGRYKLFMVYPRQELLDRKLTLDEAYLINASIIVELLS
ncbi:Plant UBX domain-containing protein 4 [Balamuthia mandrillaris]